MPEIVSEPVIPRLIGSGIVVVLGIIAYWLVSAFGSRYVRKAERKGIEAGARATTLWSVLRRAIQFAVGLVTILYLLSVWNLSLTPFLAVGTVFAAALGFGAQTLVRDIISGLFVLAEDQYHLGDVITIAGTTGTVLEVQLRMTVLKDFEGNIHYVPNGQITVTSNLTSGLYAQPVVDMAIGYKADIDQAMEVMADEMILMSQDPEWAESFREPPEVLGIQSLEDSAVIVRVRMATLAAERFTVRREAMRRLKKRLDAEGIEIPFPQLTIHRGD